MLEPHFRLATLRVDRLRRFTLAAVLIGVLAWALIARSPTTLLVALAFTVVGATLVARRALAVARSASFLPHHQRALALLTEGRAQEAYGSWLELLERVQPLGAWTALVVQSLSVARLRLGDPAGALKLASAVFDGGWDRAASLAPQRHVMRASFAVVLAANRCWDEAERLIADAAPGSDGLWISARVQLAARRGRFDEGAAIVRKGWQSAEAAGRPDSLRALRVLAAYCIANCASQEPYRTSDALPAEAQTYLAGVHPFARGTLEWLWVEWPELEVFARAHGLAA